MNTIASKLSPITLASAPEGRPRILVVDDSRVIRSAIKKILDSDFDVTLAESGDVAWSFLAREHNFQMLVTDIEMPGIDGYELICRIRASDQSALKQLPILTITGADDEQTKERAFACGATDFITKPIDGIQLKARAQSYVRLDQSARTLAEKATQLEDQAITDPLTGLRSRRYFLQRGEQDLAYCARNDKDLTVIRFDIDGYKDIYRKFGEEVGDRILAWLGGVTSTSARVEDTVARVGGAKFAILASATDIGSARAVCQRIRDAIHAKPFLHNGDTIKITLSFGLAGLVQDSNPQIEGLLSLADERVGRAIIDGGDRVCVSVLGEVAPSIEEVVLDIPPVVDVGTARTADIGELEIPAAQDSPMILEIPTPPAAAGTMAQLVSVDKALQLIAEGHSKLLEPYLRGLADQLRPLLALIARQKH